MKKKYTIIISLFLYAIGGYSQSIAPKVISSGGTWQSAGGYSLSYTFGQPPNVSTFFAGSNYLTQGFQQPLQQPSAPCTLMLTFMIIDASCTEICDGQATVSATGGTLPYTYFWDDPLFQTTETAASLCEGTYYVTVTDSLGCSATDSVVIISTSDITLNTITADASCMAVCDGVATVFATGGTEPYSYLWNDPAEQTNAIATYLCAGTYCVTVTDFNGCYDTAYVTINSQYEIILNIDITDATCGNEDGSAAVSVENPFSPPFLYQWSSGDTLPTADSLPAGIYMVTVTDNYGCSNFALATISDIGFSITEDVTNVTCNGGSDGAITIFLSGGTSPFTFEWSNGDTIPWSISNLTAGPYEVYITDANSCIAIASIMVTEPEELILTFTTTDAICGGSDGSATVSVTGGTGSYTYEWSTGGTENIISGLFAGVYDVTVTDDNGCTASAATAISNIGAPVITIDSIINIGYGETVGTIYISVSGGITGIYTYLWSDGSTTEDLIDVPVGDYYVLVTDDSCTATANASIINLQPPPNPICVVTVDTTNGKNLLVWEKQQTQGVAYYNIYKETTQAGVYNLIGNVPYNDMSVFTDLVSNPLQRSWRYKISVVDSSGYESELSDEHKTMHLTVNPGFGVINLIWDYYEGFDFYSYIIYKGTSADNLQPLDTMPSNLFTYTDFTPGGANYYYIAVVMPDTCEPTIAKTQSGPYSQSLSNIDECLMVGIEPNLSGQELPYNVLIYPNPSKGIFTLEIYDSEIANYDLRIYDVLGREIIKSTLSSDRVALSNDRAKIVNRKSKIDLSDYSEGIYLLQIITDKGIVNRKVVIE